MVNELPPGFKYVLWGLKKRYPPTKEEQITITPGNYTTEEKLRDELNRLLAGRGIAFNLVTEGGEK